MDTNDITTEMCKAVQDSLEALRATITDVRYAPYVEGQTCETLQFNRNGRKEFGCLKGRNRDLVLSGGEADKAIAVRVILDGDSWPAL